MEEHFRVVECKDGTPLLSKKSGIPAGITHSEALQKTHPKLLSRAASPSAACTTKSPLSLFPNAETTLATTRESEVPGLSNTGPISSFDTEPTQSNQTDENGECTPRSQTVDPFEFVSVVDTEPHSTALLFGSDGCLDLNDPSASQFDSPSDLFLPLQYDWSLEGLLSDSAAGIQNPLPELSLYPNSAWGLDSTILGCASVPADNNSNDWAYISGNTEDTTFQEDSNSRLLSFPHWGPPHSNMDAAQISNAPNKTPHTETLIGQNEPYLEPALISATSPYHKDLGSEQNKNKRKFSEEDCAHDHTDINAGACTSCLSTAEVTQNRPLACLFYKRNPGRHRDCMNKSFKNISSLGQHLDKHHTLRLHHCTRCWNSFDDQRSLEVHTECQPTGGIPVDELQISKARGGPTAKWYWTWTKLFGEAIPPPQCPHPHPLEDMAAHVLGQFVQHLREKGSNFTICEIEELRSHWVAPFPD
ncbi:hypothetical protein F4677DRAFT_461929 [Hypoxylon crocopeplum]|nr:hypothetical protein F4677DRAFT_461929 [Hypoxylon crocopeplum]